MYFIAKYEDDMYNQKSEEKNVKTIYYCHIIIIINVLIFRNSYSRLLVCKQHLFSVIDIVNLIVTAVFNFVNCHSGLQTN